MKSMNLFSDAGAKSSKALFGSNTIKENTNQLPPAPIQDENCNLTFTLKGKTFSLNINSEEERERVKEEVNSSALTKYDWFKEKTGEKHWVLYNTEMYEVKDSYLHYKESSDLATELPINVTSCYSMFAHCENLWTLDLSSFNTENIKNFSHMFLGCENLYHIDVSDKWNTDVAITADNVFEDCYRLPHYRDGRTGLEMCCSVNEGGYFHYVGEEDDYE